MQSTLITGANRGIGLALAQQILANGSDRVFATCRNPEAADELNELARLHTGRVHILQLDVDDANSIQRAVESVGSEAASLELLINNAGVSGSQRARDMGKLDAAQVSQVLTTNAVAPVIVTQAFRGLLKRAANPRVVMISSGMGSIAGASGGAYAYRMSKAAMNMAARILSLDSAMAGIITVTVAPGWVRTDMGGASASLSPEASASAVMALANGLGGADNGRFYRYDGSELEW